MQDRTVRADRRLQAFIRIQRDVLGWTQAEAAEGAGMSAARWRQIENGGKVPLPTLARVAFTLGIKPGLLRDQGYAELADAVQLRADFLAKDGQLPPFVLDDAEAYIWHAPGVSESIRKALILHLRTMRRAEADPVARALLGPGK